MLFELLEIDLTVEKKIEPLLPFYVGQNCFYSTADRKNNFGEINFQLLANLKEGKVTNVRPILKTWNDLSRKEVSHILVLGMTSRSFGHPLASIMDSINIGPGSKLTADQFGFLISAGVWVFGQEFFADNRVLRYDKM